MVVTPRFVDYAAEEDHLRALIEKVERARRGLRPLDAADLEDVRRALADALAYCERFNSHHGPAPRPAAAPPDPRGRRG